MEDFCYGMDMEWNKIASMEYGKNVFHPISYHALVGVTFFLFFLVFFKAVFEFRSSA